MKMSAIRPTTPRTMRNMPYFLRFSAPYDYHIVPTYFLPPETRDPAVPNEECAPTCQYHSGDKQKPASFHISLRSPSGMTSPIATDVARMNISTLAQRI